MNPSYEAMERARREKLASLLQIRREQEIREQVVKRLDELHLCGDSHAMLSQIAYAINPYVGAWDAESCDHLRRVLAELIGEAHEAASGAEHRCACGAGGCDLGHEQTALDSERQEAVNKLRGTFLDTGSALKKLATALGVYWDASNTNKSAASLQRRLIHLLGDDEYYVLDTSKAKIIGCEPDASESDDGTSVTKELREWITLHKTKITSLSLDDCSIDEGLTEEGKQLVAIADRIDARVNRLAHDVEMWRDRAEDMRMERDGACVERNKMQTELDELERLERFDQDIAIAAFGDDNAELRKLLSSAARLLANAERDRDENYHLWMDCKQKALQSDMTIGGLEDECDELQSTIADLDEQLKRRKAKCLRYKTHIDQMQGGSKRLRKELREQEGTYLDLLRDAARDYKELRDKLYHVARVCQSYTEAKDA